MQLQNSVCIGGNRSGSRKKKVVDSTATADDKKHQCSLLGIEEVNNYD